MLEIYKPLSERNLSQRKFAEYQKYSQVIAKGRQNPIWFIEEFMGIKLIDYQKWVLMNSWWRPYVVWVCCRSWGKTALASILLMAKMLLIPNYRTYISTTTAEQSVEVFRKIEEIALQRNPSFRSCTDVFANEVDLGSGHSKTGFIHDKAGHYFSLFNGSKLVTLSGNADANRGKRGSVFFDECGFQTEKQMRANEPFANQDTNVGLSTEKLIFHEPLTIPLQLLYASSAGEETFPFFDRYVEYSKKMIIGDPNYFVCDLNIDALLNFSTVDGKPIQPFISRTTVENFIEADPDGADKELFNKFKRGAGKNAVVKEEVLMRNSSYRVPVQFNDTKKRKFIFCYDPARNYDGSILSIWELLHNKKDGYTIQLQNTVSMIDFQQKKKTPLPMNEQVRKIRELMLKYNGEDVADWENIEFYIDAGAGGGGVSAVADQLLEDWQDHSGQWHNGIIDPEHPAYESSKKRYRNAIPILHLIEPVKYKRIIYNALERNSRENLINFTRFEKKEYILIENPDTKNNEEPYIQYQLSDDEIDILVQNELMKTEISYMCRYETSDRNIKYELKSDKRNTMHDDRAYTAAMAAYALSVKRRDELINKPNSTNIHQTSFILTREPKIRRR